jgi:hypothetical protein
MYGPKKTALYECLHQPPEFRSLTPANLKTFHDVFDGRAASERGQDA